MTEDDGSGMPGIGDIITAIKWVADFISTPKGTANVSSDQGSWRMSANDVAHHETALYPAFRATAYQTNTGATDNFDVTAQKSAADSLPVTNPGS